MRQKPCNCPSVGPVHPTSCRPRARESIRGEVCALRRRELSRVSRLRLARVCMMAGSLPTTTRAFDVAPTVAASGFEFPALCSFPPMYTCVAALLKSTADLCSRQPNEKTWASQSKLWTELVLSYCRFHRVFRLELGDAGIAASDLWSNRALDRAPVHSRRSLTPQDAYRRNYNARSSTCSSRPARQRTILHRHDPHRIRRRASSTGDGPTNGASASTPTSLVAGRPTRS